MTASLPVKAELVPVTFGCYVKADVIVITEVEGISFPRGKGTPLTGRLLCANHPARELPSFTLCRKRMISYVALLCPLPFHLESFFSPGTWRVPCRLQLSTQAPQQPYKATIVIYCQTNVCLTTNQCL